MTARTMLERLRKHIGARRDGDLASRIGLSRAEVSRINAGLREDGMRVATLQTISECTELPIGQLAEWWAEEDITQQQKRETT